MRISYGLIVASVATVYGSAAFAGATIQAHLDQSGVNLEPAYPASAAPGRESGDVVVRVSLHDDGSVRKLDMIKSSGFDDLDTAGMNAARLWRYVPAMDNGNSVDGSVVVQIVFNPPPEAASN